MINLHKLEKDLTSTILQFNKNENLIDYKHLLLDKNERKEYDSLVKCVTEGTKLSLLDQAITEFNRLCSDIHYITHQVVITPILKQLHSVQSTKMWIQFAESSYHLNELPDYSLSPQEYITQVSIRKVIKLTHLTVTLRNNYIWSTRPRFT